MSDAAHGPTCAQNFPRRLPRAYVRTDAIDPEPAAPRPTRSTRAGLPTSARCSAVDRNRDAGDPASSPRTSWGRVGRPAPVAELVLEHLPGRVAWKVVDEVDRSRQLVAREPFAGERDELRRRRL